MMLNNVWLWYYHVLVIIQEWPIVSELNIQACLVLMLENTNCFAIIPSGLWSIQFELPLATALSRWSSWWELQRFWVRIPPEWYACFLFFTEQGKYRVYSAKTHRCTCVWVKQNLTEEKDTHVRTAQNSWPMIALLVCTFHHIWWSMMLSVIHL